MRWPQARQARAVAGPRSNDVVVGWAVSVMKGKSFLIFPANGSELAP